ncbi:MAG: glycerol-3-phosphate dehydrogenase [Actinomycetota bacterium]|nr:glycerol-3-phosphate dehydrogenase [Actinomycetota bacterium]
MSEFDRAIALARLAGEPFDVLVVGGGITGAGVALDAASRGLRTALVERDDFASGTSSHSSKLVHGGLRYLNQKEFGLVTQSLAERQRLLANAPHLVRRMPFVFPVYGGAAAARGVGAALWAYDLAGGARIGHVHRKITAEDALSRVPALRPGGFSRAYLYYDAHVDDARLTLAVARTAALDHGAAVANHTAYTGLLRGATGRVAGATVRADGRDIEVKAAVVVNAAGVWVDEVAGLDPSPAGGPPAIRPAKGVHLAFMRSKLPSAVAAVLPAPEEGRTIFVIPWPGSDRVYVGTTDTDYKGPLDQAWCTRSDVDYLLEAVNAVTTERLHPSDVVGFWAGLRPLVADAGTERSADLSRRHRITTSSAGVVTVTGGKLTTYRRMAADTVDQVVELLGAGAQSRTASLKLRGAPTGRREGASAVSDSGPSSHLARRYGTEIGMVQNLVDQDPDLSRPLVQGLPYLAAEAVHAVRHEMARTLDDVLDRRLRARMLARDASAAVAGDVARLIGPDLGWTDDEADSHAEDYRVALMAEAKVAGLPLGDVDRRGRRT